jgi:voltage-dependent potassium channel beta subunit
MHYRRLGRSGIKVSEISLGAWITFGHQMDPEDAVKLIHEAFDHGINYFDNADVYGDGSAEITMGKAIKTLPREALVISSKVFYPTMPGPNGRGLSRKHITESIEASLRRLGTDYLDIYFCHRYDPDTQLEEIVRTMETLIQQGKILYWGTSEWSADQIARCFGEARQHNVSPLSVEQPQYNLFNRERVETELRDVVREYGLGLMTWGPLNHGILSGKYNQSIPEGSRATLDSMRWLRDLLTRDRLDKVRLLTDLGQSLGLTTAQLAIAWILRLKEISSVVTGATTPEQLDENLIASEALPKMTEEVLTRIDEIMDNAPI